MSEEANKETFRRVIEEGYSKGHLDILDEVFASAFVEHQAGIVPPTVDGVKGSITFLRVCLPGPEAGHRRYRRQWRQDLGTHCRSRHSTAGQFMGVPPTSKAFAITVMDVCRFENGKIVEHWGVADQLALMTQIGALPRPPQG